MSDRFTFDPDLTPEDNIQLFLQFLEQADPELTALLKDALAVLLPLPEPGSERNAKRSHANEVIASVLDSPGTKANS